MCMVASRIAYRVIASLGDGRIRGESDPCCHTVPSRNDSLRVPSYTNRNPGAVNQLSTLAGYNTGN